MFCQLSKKYFLTFLGKSFPGSAAEAAEAGQRGQANSLRKAPPPPKKIKEFLDKFIVGKGLKLIRLIHIHTSPRNSLLYNFRKLGTN